ncbi:MAG: DUF59 domain-containing protein [Phycisphaerae bacterium]
MDTDQTNNESAMTGEPTKPENRPVSYTVPGGIPFPGKSGIDVPFEELSKTGRTDSVKASPQAEASGDNENAATSEVAPPRPPMRPSGPINEIQRKAMESSIVETLKTIYDPEIPVNIYDLGLIYEIEVEEDSSVAICMTLTSPACPVAGSLVAEVENRTRAIEGVYSCQVDLVWDPPWSPDRLSEAARLQLNL